MTQDGQRTPVSLCLSSAPRLCPPQFGDYPVLLTSCVLLFTQILHCSSSLGFLPGVPSCFLLGTGWGGPGAGSGGGALSGSAYCFSPAPMTALRPFLSGLCAVRQLDLCQPGLLRVTLEERVRILNPHPDSCEKKIQFLVLSL